MGTPTPQGEPFAEAAGEAVQASVKAVRLRPEMAASMQQLHERGVNVSESFKWMGGRIAALLLSGSLITTLNGIAG